MQIYTYIQSESHLELLLKQKKRTKKQKKILEFVHIYITYKYIDIPVYRTCRKERHSLLLAATTTA